MSKRKIVISFGGGSFFSTLLLLTFVLLKVTNVIAWSWLWVLSPLWVPFAVSVIFACGFLIFLAIIAICAIIFGRR